MIYPTPQYYSERGQSRPVGSIRLDTAAGPAGEAWRAAADRMLGALPGAPRAAGVWTLSFDSAPSLPSAEARATWEQGAFRRDRFTLTTTAGDADVTTRLYAESPTGALCAVRVAAELAQPDGSCALGEVVDFPAIEHRGILEAFYADRLYSAQERVRLIRLAARLRQDRYVYGPKNDPYHRKLWEQPYPPEALRPITLAAAAAREELLDFFWAISPAQRYDARAARGSYGFDRIEAKLRRLHEACGVTNFALFLDDRNVFDARRDVPLMARFCEFVKKHWPSARILIVGDWYARFPVPYTDEMGLGVTDPTVELLWTGPMIYSWRITRASLEGITRSFRRPPSIWDNAPLLPGPLRGRAADLWKSIRALYSNPVLNELNRHDLAEFERALGPIADYGWNSTAYQPDRSWAAWNQLRGASPLDKRRRGRIE